MSQPLPPEVPAPRAEQPARLEGNEDAAGPGTDGAEAAGAAGEDWWRFDGVREEWRDTWATHGQEGLAAAHELGASIGEAVAAHLPNPHTEAEKRGLDIRWMRLKYNVPGFILALLASWRGSAPAGLPRSLAENGPVALLGWILLPALAVGLFMLTPVGGPLGSVLADLVRTVLRGLGVLVARAWNTAFTGYLLRLVVAVAVWGVIIVVARLVGRLAVNWLTGV
ncbi:hypothetical protein [Streptomyces sp. NPDC093109]|uniref:hypothetical protein n=1 Tax=Streptomyces sp. NPDC093109 TaxID=3154977 RepID=UPI00344E1E19